MENIRGCAPLPLVLAALKKPRFNRVKQIPWSVQGKQFLKDYRNLKFLKLCHCENSKKLSITEQKQTKIHVDEKRSEMTKPAAESDENCCDKSFQEQLLEDICDIKQHLETSFYKLYEEENEKRI